MEELDSKDREGFFGDKEKGVVTWAESQGLPYLDACIKESFRLHPAPGLPIERIVPPQGAEIAGHFIKGGTIVGCNAWVVHRRPEIFGEDVEVFRPERWIEGDEKKIKEMGATLLHFGMGARTCIGKNISLLEIYKVIPTVLRRFEVCCSSLPLEGENGLGLDFDADVGCRYASKTRPRNGQSTTPGSSAS